MKVFSLCSSTPLLTEGKLPVSLLYKISVIQTSLTVSLKLSVTYVLMQYSDFISFMNGAVTLLPALALGEGCRPWRRKQKV